MGKEGVTRVHANGSKFVFSVSCLDILLSLILSASDKKRFKYMIENLNGNQLKSWRSWYMYCTDSISIDSVLGCVGTYQLQQRFQRERSGIRGWGGRFPFSIPRQLLVILIIHHEGSIIWMPSFLLLDYFQIIIPFDCTFHKILHYEKYETIIVLCFNISDQCRQEWIATYHAYIYAFQ